jgi:hypothetical protein
VCVCVCVCVLKSPASELWSVEVEVEDSVSHQLKSATLLFSAHQSTHDVSDVCMCVCLCLEAREKDIGVCRVCLKE